MKPELAPRMLLNPVHCLSLGFGSGLAPWAPGTLGTVVGVPIYLVLSHSLSLLPYLLVIAVMGGVGIALCGATARHLGVHDHPGIVWDEIVGFLITMIAAPPGWIWILLGFGLFRTFDVWKPWPIGSLDRGTSGGLGIMVDDVMAGVYAFLVLQVLVRFTAL